MLIDGHLLVGTSLMSFTDLQAGLDHFEQAIALFPDPPTATRTARVGNDPRVSCLTTSAFTLWMLGQSDRAAERADAALALAAALDHPFTTAYARYPRGPAPALAPRAGGCARARHRTARSRRRARVPDLDRDRQRPPRGGPGRARPARRGDGRACGAGSDSTASSGHRPSSGRSCCSCRPAPARPRARPAEGLQALDRSIEILGADSSATMLPEAWIAKGDLIRLLAPGGEGGRDAEPWYRRALDRATELGAKTAQLRAATRLARLRVEGGDPAAAASLLSPDPRVDHRGPRHGRRARGARGSSGAPDPPRASGLRPGRRRPPRDGLDGALAAPTHRPAVRRLRLR